MRAGKSKLNDILEKVDTSDFGRSAYAVFFVWFLTDIEGKEDCTVDEIIKCFQDSQLNLPEKSKLRYFLRTSNQIVKGIRTDSFRIHRHTLTRLRQKYGTLLEQAPSPEEVIRERLDVSNTPFLNSTDIENAYKMGQLYVAIHCLENSVRYLIRDVLSKTLGNNWWDKAASTPMVQKLQSRKSREAKHRWLSSRGADELNYMDWSDLVTLIRKFHKDFERLIPDIKFVELRLEELENLRNTIAHSGVLPDDELNRVELALKDWCKQVS